MAMQMNEFFYSGNEPQWLKNGNRQRSRDYSADFDYPTSGRTVPTYEFMVPMCCAKCEEKVREELSEMDDVYEIFVDQLSQRVVVTGFVDPYQALKKMKRIKKKSQFWNGKSTPRKSSLRNVQTFDQKKARSQHHDTVYRSFPSQVSFNREPSSRSSNSRRMSSYDDEIPYLRPASANRNMFRASYDDEIPYSNLRPAHRNMYRASYDDEIPHSNLRPAHRNMYYPGTYDDDISYADARPYRNRFYGSYDDEISYSDVRPASSYMPGHRFVSSSSSMFNSRPALRYETVPPFAQEYETGYFQDEYPFYSHY